MNYTSKIKIAETVFSQEIDGEIVLLDMASENYFGLDAVGSQIWKLLQSGKTLQETKDILLQDFEVSAEQLTQDLEEFVGKMLENGLIAIDD